MHFKYRSSIFALAALVNFCMGCVTHSKRATQGSLPTEKTIKHSMRKALAWQEAHHIFAKSPTDWTNGAYYTGVSKAHAATKDKIYSNALLKQAIANNWQPWERFYHADDLAICYSYLYLNSLGIKQTNLKPTDTIIEKHLYTPHEWREGKGNKEQVMLWWWCDALFMAPPVLSNYAKLQNKVKYLDEMHKYYQQTYALLYDQKDHLWARDNRFIWQGQPTDRKEPNGKKIYWSRGNGWVLGGLALTLDAMPSDYKYRPFYENLFKEMAERVKSIQQPDGLWYTSLLSPESFEHGEVSGSGFFTFGLAWGINQGLLSETEYRPVVEKAWNALMLCQQADGKVGWVQNIGFDPKPADKDSWQNYGTGAYLLAGSEILKLK